MKDSDSGLDFETLFVTILDDEPDKKAEERKYRMEHLCPLFGYGEKQSEKPGIFRKQGDSGKTGKQEKKGHSFF